MDPIGSGQRLSSDWRSRSSFRSSRLTSRLLEHTGHFRTYRCWADRARFRLGSNRSMARHSYIPVDAPESVESLRSRYLALEQGPSASSGQVWLNWVSRLRDTGEYVGTVEATVFPDRRAQLAYTTFEQHQRKGYAMEACTLVVESLFGQYKCDSVFLLVDTRNVASISLATSLGFERTEYLPNADFFRGETSHEYRFELHRRS